MLSRYSILGFLSLLFILVSCSTDSVPVYNLSVTVSPAESGIVFPVEDKFDEGSVATLFADPQEGWNFVEWRGDYNGNENPASVTINKDTDIIAVFERKKYPLTISTVGEGDVDEKVLQQKTTEYELGTIVELSALPEKGWVFTEWQGGINGSKNPEQIQVKAATDVTAVFEKGFFDLDIGKNGSGVVQYDLISGSRSESGLEFGTVIELSALADDGWYFTGWSGDLTGSDNPAIFEITTENNIIANFAIQNFDLSVIVTGEGTIYKELIDGSVSENGYSYGSVVELTANSSEGYEFKGWSGDVVSDEQTIEIVVNQNISVEANFEEKEYLEIGKTYEASNGLAVTLNGFTITEESGRIRYNISYTLENNTDAIVDEGSFKLFAENPINNQQQFGYFGRLNPGDSINRLYTFEEVKFINFIFLAYHDEIFGADTPPKDALIWKVLY